MEREDAEAVVDDLVPGPDAPSEQGLAREVAYIFATGEAPAWRGPSDEFDTPVPNEEVLPDALADGRPAAGGPGGVIDIDDADEPDDVEFADDVDLADDVEDPAVAEVVE